MFDALQMNWNVYYLVSALTSNGFAMESTIVAIGKMKLIANVSWFYILSGRAYVDSLPSLIRTTFVIV